MSTRSHRDYFRRYRLNVEQYGEILVAEAFRGEKKGDEQPGYDVEVAAADFLDVLKCADGVSRFEFAPLENGARIEVKSKLTRTKASVASVVHCSDCKLFGRASRSGKHRPGMTHLAVVLVAPGERVASGSAEDEGRVVSA